MYEIGDARRDCCQARSGRRGYRNGPSVEMAWSERVAEIVGVDFSERSIELCRRRLAADPRPNVRFVQADEDTGMVQAWRWRGRSAAGEARFRRVGVVPCA